jgi:hypothetical protein
LDDRLSVVDEGSVLIIGTPVPGGSAGGPPPDLGPIIDRIEALEQDMAAIKPIVADTATLTAWHDAVLLAELNGTQPPVWDVTQTYPSGSVVLHDGSLYVALADAPAGFDPASAYPWRQFTTPQIATLASALDVLVGPVATYDQAQSYPAGTVILYSSDFWKASTDVPPAGPLPGDPGSAWKVYGLTMGDGTPPPTMLPAVVLTPSNVPCGPPAGVTLHFNGTGFTPNFKCQLWGDSVGWVTTSTVYVSPTELTTDAGVSGTPVVYRFRVYDSVSDLHTPEVTLTFFTQDE